MVVGTIEPVEGAIVHVPHGDSKYWSVSATISVQSAYVVVLEPVNNMLQFR